MKPHCLTIAIGIVLCLVPGTYQTSDTYAEELFLKPLPTGHINSFFQFTTNWELRHNDSRECRSR